MKKKKKKVRVKSKKRLFFKYLHDRSKNYVENEK